VQVEKPGTQLQHNVPDLKHRLIVIELSRKSVVHNCVGQRAITPREDYAARVLWSPGELNAAMESQGRSGVLCTTHLRALQLTYLQLEGSRVAHQFQRDLFAIGRVVFVHRQHYARCGTLMHRLLCSEPIPASESGKR
jgi:hypothetical protein